ncbi:MAG: hypothetical protein IPM42_05380 [Saprospiraceae bacterium]|nr:hypothetical protein [Saprospiraceae bacterium]
MKRNSENIFCLLIMIVCLSCSKNEKLLPCEDIIKATPELIWEMKYDNDYIFYEFQQKHDENYIVSPVNDNTFLAIDVKNEQSKELIIEKSNKGHYIISNDKFYTLENGNTLIATNLETLEQEYFNFNEDVIHSYSLKLFENDIYIFTLFAGNNLGVLKFNKDSKQFEKTLEIDFYNISTDVQLYRNKEGQLCVIVVSGNTLLLTSYNTTNGNIEYQIRDESVTLMWNYNFSDQIILDKNGRCFLNLVDAKTNESLVFDYLTGEVLYKFYGWAFPLDDNYANINRPGPSNPNTFPLKIVKSNDGKTILDPSALDVYQSLFVISNMYFVHTSFGKRFYFVNLKTGCVEFYLEAGFNSILLKVKDTNELVLLDTENKSVKKFRI